MKNRSNEIRTNEIRIRREPSVFGISKHLGLPVLLELFRQREWHLGQPCVTLIISENIIILVSRYHYILENTRPLPLSQSIIFQSLSSPPLSFVVGQSPPSPSQ